MPLRIIEDFADHLRDQPSPVASKFTICDHCQPFIDGLNELIDDQFLRLRLNLPSVGTRLTGSATLPQPKRPNAIGFGICLQSAKGRDIKWSAQSDCFDDPLNVHIHSAAGENRSHMLPQCLQDEKGADIKTFVVEKVEPGPPTLT